MTHWQCSLLFDATCSTVNGHCPHDVGMEEGGGKVSTGFRECWHECPAMGSDGFVDYHVHKSWYFALSIRPWDSKAPTTYRKLFNRLEITLPRFIVWDRNIDDKILHFPHCSADNLGLGLPVHTALKTSSISRFSNSECSPADFYSRPWQLFLWHIKLETLSLCHGPNSLCHG